MDDQDSIPHPLSESSRLKEELAQAQGIVKKYQSLLALSTDPAQEIANLRDQVVSMSSKCAELQEELELLHDLRVGSREKALFQPESVIQAVMEAKPMLSESDHAMLRLVIPVVERMWNSGKTVQGAKGQRQTANTPEMKGKDDKIAALRKENEVLKGKISVFELSLDTLTTETMGLQDEITDLKAQRENLIVELASREEENEELRPAAKQKYQLECEKQELQLACDKLERQLEKLKQDMEELIVQTAAKTLEMSSEKDRFSGEIAALKRELEGKERDMQELVRVKGDYEGKLAGLEGVESQAAQEHQAYVRLSSSHQALSQDLEDTKTEMTIQAKKYQNEIKALRSEILKERSQRDELQHAYDQCHHDLLQLQDIRTTHARVAAASISEKKFVETLLEKNRELERANKRLTLEAAQAEDVKMELIREKQRSAGLAQELVTLQSRRNS